MEELDNHSPETNTPVSSDGDALNDHDTTPSRLSNKMVFLLLLTLAIIVVIVILALIGPVADGDIGIVLSL